MHGQRFWVPFCCEITAKITVAATVGEGVQGLSADTSLSLASAAVWLQHSRISWGCLKSKMGREARDLCFLPPQSSEWPTCKSALRTAATIGRISPSEFQHGAILVSEGLYSPKGGLGEPCQHMCNISGSPRVPACVAVGQCRTDGGHLRFICRAPGGAYGSPSVLRSTLWGNTALESLSDWALAWIK